MPVVDISPVGYGYECPACGFQSLPLVSSRLEAVLVGTEHNIEKHLLAVPTERDRKGDRLAAMREGEVVN